MAAESRVRGPRVGCAVKQALVDSLHAKLMGSEEESRKLVRGGSPDEETAEDALAEVDSGGTVAGGNGPLAGGNAEGAEDTGMESEPEVQAEIGPDLETDRGQPGRQQQLAGPGVEEAAKTMRRYTADGLDATNDIAALNTSRASCRGC